jgi:histone-lysine N-methyltransferase SETMAR
VRPKRRKEKIASPHTSILTRETIAEFGWTDLPPPPYSPDLVPSDFHLFGLVKDGLCGKHFVSDNTVIVALKKMTWRLTAT